MDVTGPHPPFFIFHFCAGNEKNSFLSLVFLPEYHTLKLSKNIK